MAVTQNSFTGNGSTTNFSFTFPYIKEADVKAKIDGVTTTAFTLANATTVSFTSAPASGAAIIIFRDTDNDEKTATFFAGSAVKAEDLNSNFDQVLFTAQEVDNNALQSLGGTMTGDLNFGQNANIIFEGATDDVNETTLTVADPTADRTITLPDVTGTVVTTGDTATVATGMIADSAITSAKISDGTIATGDIADDAITTAKIADANVTTALIADANVTTAKLASDAVTTAKITDANVTTAKIANDAITAAKIAADAVGSSEIAANAVTSSELADASVDTAAIIDANVTTAKVADSAITTAKINDSAITSAKIGANQVVEGKIADNAVTTAKIPDSGVTTPKIADNAVTNAKLADAELRELATMGSTTASALADLTQAEVQILDGATVSTNELNILDGVTANATEINQLDGNTLTNSFTASSTTQYPSSNAISGYVLGLMDNLGGFVAIANENSFPTTNPDPSDDAGTVVSISDAGGLVVSASGTASGQTTGGTAVTITGFPSALQSSTLPAGQGLQVVSTSTLNTYTYHKVLGTDADIAQLNDDVNDFFARYRIGSTNPTTDLDAGDLFFNTSTGKMLVYDGTVSAWEEVQAVGNYFINTLSSSGGTGGGSATFNGSAYRFTLSNPGSVAQQHIVSINGVIQKPNSGTSQPSEGFAIDNADIILAAAPATGSEFFIVTVGTSVNIGAPSNDTINNAMVKADAAIAGTKISPDFGSQNVVTTGSVGIGLASPGAPLAVASSGGINAKLVGRDNGTVDEAQLYFMHNDNSTTHGIIEGKSTSLNLYGGTTLAQTIDSSGRVGIGTTSMPGMFQIHQAASNTSNYINITNATTGGSSWANGMLVGVTNGGDALVWQNENSALRFGTNNLDRMRIDSSGNVGIGATSINNSYGTNVNIHSTTTNGARLKISDGTSGNGNVDGLDIIHQSGIGYIIQRENNDIRISTNNTERMRIDSSGRVGIGSTSPTEELVVRADAPSVQLESSNASGRSYGLQSTNDGYFHAYDGSAGVNRVTLSAAGNVGIKSTNPLAQLHILNTSGTAGFYLSRANGTAVGDQISIQLSTDSAKPRITGYGDGLSFFTAATSGTASERMRLTSNGLTFNGDTAAANALDDYEEGTFTPTPQFGGGSTGMTYNTAPTGHYTKIGNLVFVQLGFHFSNKGSSTGSFTIGGLPYSVANTGSFRHPNNVVNAHNMNSTGMIFGALGSGTSINYRKLNESSADTVPGHGDFTNNTGFYHSMVYTT